MRYLDMLEDIKVRNPERLEPLLYDAIYVDEGQDFSEQVFQLLKGTVPLRHQWGAESLHFLR
jgi:hypothetical protein